MQRRRPGAKPHLAVLAGIVGTLAENAARDDYDYSKKSSLLP